MDKPDREKRLICCLVSGHEVFNHVLQRFIIVFWQTQLHIWLDASWPEYRHSA
ncbi:MULTISPECIES: hypothetical protein [unclassified Arsukibacterium]|uniref:hypothetical protein n=1 Tax=unclassified Arsukibacterium TaxID=2635278 RepID=UPI0025BC90C3|nr:MULTISPECIES: hypothetical protein [unclassified Arsukibacterium]